MAKKLFKIEKQEIMVRASADTPRLYWNYFKGDIFEDMKEIAEAAEEDLTIELARKLENIAFIFAEGYKNFNSPEAWLEQFEYFSLRKIYPYMIDVWVETLTGNGVRTGDGSGKTLNVFRFFNLLLKKK